ncbi:hypothetical protein SCHPADRAFT_990169, partial [Schizopora paradoxa]
MEQSQRGLVSGMGDPKAVWDTLEAHHEQKVPATCFASYEKLLGIQKRDDESLPALALRVEAALCSVKNACPSSFTLEQLHSDLACMALIRALPAKDYSSFRSLLLMKEEITLAALTDALFLEEQNRKPICAFCDISGHSEANCFKRQSASAQAKAKTAEYAGKKRSRGKGKQKANAAVEASSSSASASSTSDSKPSTTTANRAEFAGHASSPPLSPLPTGSDWIADTGATIHMTPHLHWFRTPIRLADSSIIYSAGVGDVEFEPVRRNGQPGRRLVFQRVLHVPDLCSNLFSVLFLTKNKGFDVHIFGDFMQF